MSTEEPYQHSQRTLREQEELIKQPHGARPLRDHVSINEWAGGIEQTKASIPEVRVGKRWYSTLWLIPISIAMLLVMVAIAQQLRSGGYPWVDRFLEDYPGTAATYAPAVEGGFPGWLRWQHLFNLFFMMYLMRAGVQILADHPRLYLNAGSRPDSDWLRLRGPIPADRRDPADPRRVWKAKDDAVAIPKWLGIPGIRHSIGLARWWHFSFDTLWLLNGIVFYVLLFSTDQWKRLVPTSWDVFPNALSTAIQYASLNFPANEGFTNYNGLQIIAYFSTIFIFAPLALLTGLLQAPAVAARLGTGRGPLNRQVARTIHFCVLLWMVFFILVHTVMVFITGLVKNLNHIVLGTNTSSFWPLIVYIVVMVILSILWLGASPFTLRYPRVVQLVGRFLIGWLKALMEWSAPRAKYKDKDISEFLWPNGTTPESAEYWDLERNDFADYRLTIDGLVENEVELTFQELLDMPKHEQITQHFCIQGWSGVAKWGGVRTSDILDIVKPMPTAKYAVFYSLADGSDPGAGRYYDCHKIEHMSRELTMLAYEMNGERLSVTHGAPLRLRNEDELGFKQVKWIDSIEFVASIDHLGEGQGGYNEDHEFYGYRMPI